MKSHQSFKDEVLFFSLLMSARYYSESFLITHLCLVLSSAKRRSLPHTPFIPGLVSSLLHATENRCYLDYITSQSTHILSHVIFFDLLGSLLSPSPLPCRFSSQLPSPEPLAPPSAPSSSVLSAIEQRWTSSFKIQIICHRAGSECVNRRASKILHKSLLSG